MMTVGEMLRSMREQKKIALSDVEKNIRIRTKIIAAIEQNNWSTFSSKIYIVGIIKNYSQYLGLDTNKMLAFFRRDYEKKEVMKFKTRIAARYLTPESKKYVIGGVVILFLIFFMYFGYQIKLYLSPPSYMVLSPKERLFKIEEKVKFVGKTEKDALITVYNERIYQDDNGVFEYYVPLKNGNNVILIEITGANGKKIKVKEEFMKKSPF